MDEIYQAMATDPEVRNLRDDVSRFRNQSIENEVRLGVIESHIGSIVRSSRVDVHLVVARRIKIIFSVYIRIWYELGLRWLVHICLVALGQYYQVAIGSMVMPAGEGPEPRGRL